MNAPIFDPLTPPPLWTADLPGVGGRIKAQPEDFEVEEVPAYPPSGSGEHLFLWIEKRDMGAEYFVRQVARRFDIRPPISCGYNIGLPGRISKSWKSL